MASNGTISIGFKIEGNGNGFKQLTMDADGFRKIISATFKFTQAFSERELWFDVDFHLNDCDKRKLPMPKVPHQETSFD